MCIWTPKLMLVNVVCGFDPPSWVRYHTVNKERCLNKGRRPKMMLGGSPTSPGVAGYNTHGVVLACVGSIPRPSWVRAITQREECRLNKGKQPKTALVGLLASLRGFDPPSWARYHTERGESFEFE